MTRMLLGLAGLLLCLPVYAQENSGRILLANHTVTADGINLDYEEDELVNGRFYRLLQYHSPLLKLGEETGPIRVLEYIPKKTFVVSIDASRIDEARNLAARTANAVIAMEPEWKLSKRLYSENIPEWAWLDNSNFKMWVRYYKDVDHSWAKNELANAGYQVIDEQADEGIIALSVNMDEVEQVAELPFVVHLQEMEDPGEPENYTARTNHRVNTLQRGQQDLIGYTGDGVVVGLGDDGELGEHIDFKGRLTQNAGPSTGDHGDHVAGTIFGAGNRDPRGRGMAPGAHIYYQSYPANLNNADVNFNTHNVRVTNSSYSNGCNAGYTNFTRRMDRDAIDNPPLIHVFSAGNNGADDCGYGAGNGWGNVTGGHKIAKNVIAVANLTSQDGIAGSSSRGPAEDGRLKPDVGAVGSQVYSTTDVPTPHSYTQKTGTSMSAPGVAGVLATLYEAYRVNNNSQDPHGGLLKAILLNTADDQGNPGPDFSYGYGRVNARRAAEVIETATYISGTNTGATQNYQITAPAGNVAEVKIMLYWPDLPASTNAARSLVNDLDLEVTHNGSTYEPWVLDPTPNPSSLSSNAVRARDSLNNVEQVTFSGPVSGNINIEVSAANLPGSSQEFFIVYEFIMDEVILTYPTADERFTPGTQELIRWDAPDGSGFFAAQFSADSGSTWTTINNNIAPFWRYRSWTVPQNPTTGAMMRIIRGQDTGMSQEPFTILGIPQNFSVLSNCPDSVVLSWDSVPGADGYAIYQLGSEYMDSVDFTSDTSIALLQANPYDVKWYSVAAVLNGTTGQRAVAVNSEGGTFNCQLEEDLVAVSLVSPLPGVSTDCLTASDAPVRVRLRNEGLNEVSNFSLNFSFNGGPVFTDVFTDTIAVGEEVIYTFNDSLSALTTNVPHEMEVWVDYGPDLNPYNDTIREDIFVLSENPKTAPYFDDFESFNQCSTNDNCGGTNCPLSDGWTNLPNGGYDDIDWRVNSGSTPSSGTGPNQDFNPGTSNGQYLYLEASGCADQEAILLSPCIFLDSTVTDTLVAEFRYHMLGNNMGTLAVDLLTEEGIVENVVPPISGNRFNVWHRVQFDLRDYLGEHVIVRFRGRTGDDFESDIAIDDFSISNTQMPPVAALASSSDSDPCAPDTVTFVSQSTGDISSYDWDFGPGATPQSASTAGPHQVVYTTGGVKNVTLTVGNGGGFDQETINVTVKGEPTASFSYTIAQNKVSFTDGSAHNPTSWLWEFGDGDSSMAASPVHIYPATGRYGVTLTTFNECGSSSRTDSIFISSISNLDELTAGSISVYPNPTTGELNLDIAASLDVTSIRLLDLSGKILKRYDSKTVDTKSIVKVDVSDLPEGVYIVAVETESGRKNIRVIKRD